MENKLKEQEEYIKNYNLAIEQAEKLLAGLLQYDKNIINKTFFEKHFTRLYTENYKDWTGYKLGEPIKRDGVIVTEFYLSNPQYSFQKGKRIYLSHNEYIEDIESNQKDYIIEKVKETIAKLCNNRDYCIKRRDNYTNFLKNIGNFKEDYKKLLKKYNAVNINYEIVEEIKFLS